MTAGWQSLELVRAETDLEVASQERRGVNLDTKAGLLLGFAGVLVGLTGGNPNIVQLLGQVAAAGAGVTAT